MSGKKIDTIFLLVTLILVSCGFFLFVSASLGLLARDGGATFEAVFVNQIFMGLFLGLIALTVTTNVPYKLIKKYSFHLFILGIILSALVFVPGIGFGHGGAKRWIDLRFTTFQPSEFLKLGFVLYFATWLSLVKERVSTFRYGTLPYLVFVGIVFALLFAEPDTGTAGVIAIAGTGMFFVAGGRISHLCIIILIGGASLFGMVQMKPYLQDRIAVFLNPEHDKTGAGFQLNQALIAVGSGQLTGRGFGQSIQKFTFLPEPTNDSIFAVTSEEFGFVGSSFLVLLFLFFAMRGLRLASRAPDQYGRLVIVGIILLIMTQSFINMASMVGLFPLTGVPLLFISHGGTALFFVLAEVGIILNISRSRKLKSQ